MCSFGNFQYNTFLKNHFIYFFQVKTIQNSLNSVSNPTLPLTKNVNKRYKPTQIPHTFPVRFLQRAFKTFRAWLSFVERFTHHLVSKMSFESSSEIASSPFVDLSGNTTQMNKSNHINYISERQCVLN